MVIYNFIRTGQEMDFPFPQSSITVDARAILLLYSLHKWRSVCNGHDMFTSCLNTKMIKNTTSNKIELFLNEVTKFINEINMSIYEFKKNIRQ